MEIRDRVMTELLTKRDSIENRSTGYDWYGHAVRPGLPLPGNYSGFAGTLGQEGIAVSDAFLTGLIWFLILVGGIIVSIVLLKYMIEVLFRIRILKTERLNYFRQHWLLFLGASLLRCFFIAFFMFMLLTIFEFNYGGSAGVLAITGVVFTFFFLSMFGLAGFALYEQYRVGKFTKATDQKTREWKKKFGLVPWYTTVKSYTRSEDVEEVTDQSKQSNDITETEVLLHNDERFTRRFGWLVSRYRESRWWFPATWLIYEFVRACFYGAAASHPLVQVFGLLAVECLALIYLIWARPFESTRLNVIMVYMLGVSKVLTVALSSAFEVRFNQDRIICTVIGVVIIVIQSFLTIGLMIMIVLGAISSYMSLTRNHESFRPRRWVGIRQKYFPSQFFTLPKSSCE